MRTIMTEFNKREKLIRSTARVIDPGRSFRWEYGESDEAMLRVIMDLDAEIFNCQQKIKVIKTLTEAMRKELKKGL
jgi:hypothetical protein